VARERLKACRRCVSSDVHDVCLGGPLRLAIGAGLVRSGSRPYLIAPSVLVGLDLLPSFYALSENYGDYEQDYLDEYRQVRLSAEAKAIYEALLKNGALDAVRLRREAHMSSEASKPRCEKALTELQIGLKVLPIGVAEAGAWRYAFIYEVLPRWLPDVPERARGIGRGQAKQAILDQYLRNVIATTLPAAARVFGWPLDEARRTAQALAEKGRVCPDVKVSGLGELQVVTRDVLC
jgi:hypothetical protein